MEKMNGDLLLLCSVSMSVMQHFMQTETSNLKMIPLLRFTQQKHINIVHMNPQSSE